MNNDSQQLTLLLDRKHVVPALQILYRRKNIRQKDLAEELGISRGLTCLLMDMLVSAGLVGQGKYGRCKLYEILPEGTNLLETYKLVPDAGKPPEPGQNTVPEEARRVLYDWLGGEPDVGKLRAALEEDISRIDTALERISSGKSDPALVQRIRKTAGAGAQLAKVLKDLAQANGGQAYLSMGEYHAKLERMERELSKRREPVTGMVKETRHANTVLRLLYRRGAMSASELGKELEIGSQKVRPHIEPLVAAGLAERDSGNVRRYSLTEDGKRYCGKRFPHLQGEEKGPEEPPDSVEEQTASLVGKPYFVDLTRLLYETGGIRPVEAAERLGRHEGNTCRDLKYLAMMGLAEVRKGEKDKRSNYYSLSEHGKAPYEQKFLTPGENEKTRDE